MQGILRYFVFMAKKQATQGNIYNIVQDFDLNLNEESAVELIKYAYAIRMPLVETEDMKWYRLLDLGVTNKQELKNLFDPKGKENPEGGQAQYMTTDFKPCPLVQSVNRITQNYVINKMAEIQVTGTDKLSVDKKILKRQKDLIKDYTLDLINFLGEKIGEAPIPKSTNLDALASGDEDSGKMAEDVALIDQVRSELQDDMSFAMLSEVGALKDGVESSHEIMINHYLESLNFKMRISTDIVSDLMKKNIFCYRFYTSAMDGTPQVKYIDPLTINVSPFREKDSRDKDFWFYEFVTTWEEYMKMIGGKIDLEKNREIYEANRTMNAAVFASDYPVWAQGQQYNPLWQQTILNTQIRLGYFEVKKHIHDPLTDTYYDKTIKFYYLPLIGNSLSLSPKFILDLGDLQDMHRSGGMLEYADFSLVLFRDIKYASWYDIQAPDLLRLNILYNQYLNTCTSIVPRGVIYAEETLRAVVEEMMKAKEEYMNQTGQDVSSMAGEYQKLLDSTIRKIEQKGKGIFKRRDGDADEKQLDPPTFTIQHNLYEDLAQLISQMMSIYNMMIMSLGTNPILLGQAPKQHQTLKGIELANDAGVTMLDGLITNYEFAIKEFGRRMIYYDQCVIDEFNSKTLKPTTPRAEQMKAILGTAGVGWQEIFKDMYVQQCTVLIQNRPTDEQRIMLFDYTSGLEQRGLVPIGTTLMVQEIKNYKLAKLYVLASVKRQERIAIENQMQLMERQAAAQQQAQQAQLNAEMQKLKFQNDLKNQNDMLNAQAKEQGMSKNIEERGNNRIQEKAASADIDVQKEATKQSLNLQ